SIGTPFIMNLLASPLPWERGVFLLQREVAERLLAPPGGRDYGPLSIATALAGQAVIERIVPPRAFWPVPQVDSAVVRLEFSSPEFRQAIPWRGIRRIASAIFTARRKTLRNALKGVFPDGDSREILASLEIKPERRGETLAPAVFRRLGEIWEAGTLAESAGAGQLVEEKGDMGVTPEVEDQGENQGE
ncbi:MAG: hypothetical protein LBU79_01400, partial [Planctomycetota bacterium]|nr:hypothetical protein [Planctomycetota bacterium]